ncbi:MAG: TonB family protein [Bryobacteraceae bacterium]|nr:TonB family protein [Bryobacteraceae bacterium]
MTGRTIGEFAVHKRLGEGAFGTSYLGEHTPTGRMAVLKLVRPELTAIPRIGERLRAQAISPPDLEHPGIVRLREVRVEGQEIWIIRDYCAGNPLDVYLKKTGAQPAVEGARRFCDLLAAFGHAHRRGFCHANIKPANILVDAGSFCAADFTISRLFGISASTMELLGAPEYRPPEQAAGEELDARSDVYSLGIVLRQVVSGKTGSGGQKAPEWLVPVLAKATSKDPAVRFRNAGEFRETLLGVIPAAAEAAPEEKPVIVFEAAAPAVLPGPAFGMRLRAGGLMLALGLGAAAFVWNRSNTEAAASANTVAVPSAPVAPEAASGGEAPVAKPLYITPAATKPTARITPAKAAQVVTAGTTAPQPSPAQPKPFVWKQAQTGTVNPGAPGLPAAHPEVAPGSAGGGPVLAPLEVRVGPPPAEAPAPKPAAATPRMSGQLVGAKLLRGGSPTYPPFAKQLKVSGNVRLEIRIAPDGKVVGVNALSGHPVLAAAAIEAARRWVYAPATLDGNPVSSSTQVDISFTSK